MTQKTISLPEPIYNKLKSKKRPNETFTDLILRLINEEEKFKGVRSIETFFGAFEEDSDEWDEIEKRLYKARDESQKRKTY
ncbi:MAG TPA: antitoxin VapB family protein [Candidatus Deferrimicrobium sp.]|nr:antitoxin VapB family protein [Candidatus Deferrimicrobium sp.]